jgi:hypothetical protein
MKTIINNLTNKKIKKNKFYLILNNNLITNKIMFIVKLI